MSAYTDAIKARYVPRESETDAFGRVIEVRRLRPGTMLHIRAFVGATIGAVENEAIIAASVCAATVPGEKRQEWEPPRNQLELYGRIDILEQEGMEAAVVAYSRLIERQEAADRAKKDVAAAPDTKDAPDAVGGVDGQRVGDAVAGHQAAADAYRTSAEPAEGGHGERGDQAADAPPALEPTPEPEAALA